MARTQKTFATHLATIWFILSAFSNVHGQGLVILVDGDNLFPHIWQQTFFSPLCVILCVVKLPNWEELFPQNSQQQALLRYVFVCDWSNGQATKGSARFFFSSVCSNCD